MTMDSVSREAELSRRWLGKLANAVRHRRGELAGEINGLDREVENVELGSRAALRSIEDDREVILEEMGQLQQVLEATRPPAPPEHPAPQPTQEEAPPQPEPPAAATEELPAPPAPAAPEPEPEAPIWRRLPWALILALIGGILAFFLAGRNVDAISRFALGQNEFATNDLFQFLVVAVATAFGAFAGGWIGSRLDEE